MPAEAAQPPTETAQSARTGGRIPVELLGRVLSRDRALRHAAGIQEKGPKLQGVFFHKVFFPECVAKGSRLTLGGLGVEPCSQSVVSTSATVRNRSQPFATVRGRALRRCHWGKLLQVTFHGCVTCQFAPLFHCDLHEKDMSRKQRDAFRCTGAAFGEICRLLRSSFGISVWRVVFLGCWMWQCHWDLRFRVWHRSSVFVTSLS